MGAGHTVLCESVYVRTGYHVPRSKLKVRSVKDMEIECCMYECCKLFTAALAAAIAGDDSSHDKGPVGLGRSRGAVLKYLKIDVLTVERERES